MNDTRRRIESEARSLGFDALGVTDAALPPEVRARFKEALALGRHGTMAWMETRLEQRTQPRDLWNEAVSVIMLGLSYGPASDPMEKLLRPRTGNISVYAQGDDYHDVVKKKLKTLGRWMAREFDCALKVFVDTAPVAEKPLGEKAGIGWQGKHTNLLSREHGSWLFLGSIYTTLDLGTDSPEEDHCGSCRRCLDACPTNAFPGPYQLDARRCISYLTIEHDGPIPEEFRAAMGNRIYGCDDCLAVCPWNKFAGRASEAKLHAREELTAPSLRELARLDDEAFRKLFRKSPIKRTGRDRFVRNVAIALGNSRDLSALEELRQLTEDEAFIVRDAAEWAIRELTKEEGPQHCAAGPS
jgi:epoxyqueuosine reductase